MKSTADETAVGIGPPANDGVAMTMPFPAPAGPPIPDRRPRGGPSTEHSAPAIDRFPVLRPIGFGGMGEVFLCRHPVTGLEVAVKRLRPELVGDRQSVQRFLTEARHMYHMNHPHVLRIMEVWDPPAGPYYVMPYMPAGSLADRVRP